MLKENTLVIEQAAEVKVTYFAVEDKVNEGETSPPRRRNWLKHLRGYMLSMSVIVGILVVWEVFEIIMAVPTYVLPRPSVIGETMVKNFDLLLRNFGVTALEAGLGFMLGNSVAILIAILFVHSPSMERALFPVAITIRSMPIVALAPLFLLWFGTGITPKVIIAALSAFFPTLVNAVRGFNSVDKSNLEMMYTLAASRWQIFTKLRWPAALPYIFAALKISTAACVIGALVAEWIGSDRGLGYLVVVSTFEFKIELLWATIAVTSLFTTLLFQLVGWIERWAIPWNRNAGQVE
ncbi:MAG: transporter permease [Chloroflexi bacterium]|jgi:NitT/TauT family transport system permease protein|nr:transporter permease [Chloroflexota bacterium]